MHSTVIAEMAKDNRGALSVLLMLNHAEDEYTLETIKELGITGTDIWVLYKDICGEKLDKLRFMVIVADESTLVDACSRQDRSGIELLKPELEAYDKTVE